MAGRVKYRRTTRPKGRRVNPVRDRGALPGLHTTCRDFIPREAAPEVSRTPLFRGVLYPERPTKGIRNVHVEYA